MKKVVNSMKKVSSVLVAGLMLVQMFGTSVTAQVPGKDGTTVKNIVQNGNCEEVGAWYTANASSTISVEETGGIGGSPRLKVTNAGTGSLYQKLPGLMGAKKGEKYYISARLKGATTTLGGAGIDISVNGGANFTRVAGSYVNATTGSWANLGGVYTLTADITTEKQAYIKITPTTSSNATQKADSYYLDDVRMIKLGTDGNCVVDGNCDTKDGWYLGTSGVTATVSENNGVGNSSCIEVNHAKNGALYRNIYGLAGAKAGETYYVLAKMYCADSDLGGAGIDISVNGGANFARVAGRYTTVKKGKWNLIGGLYTFTADATSVPVIRITACTSSNTAQHDKAFRLDDVMIVKKTNDGNRIFDANCESMDNWEIADSTIYSGISPTGGVDKSPCIEVDGAYKGQILQHLYGLIGAKEGEQYLVSVKLRALNVSIGGANLKIGGTLLKGGSSESGYNTVTPEWTTVSGIYTVPADITLDNVPVLQVQATTKTEAENTIQANAVFYMDDVVIFKSTEEAAIVCEGSAKTAGTITADMEIFNTTGNAIDDGYAMIALYDENGALISCKTERFDAVKHGALNKSVEFEVVETNENAFAKVFVWSNTLQPLGTALPIND